jgi:nicotinate-nucleotide adenylyltransferase
MIGVFGGTFDPIHYGHLRSALEVMEVFNLQEIRFIPSANPPHRQAPIASATERYQMLQLGLQNRTGFICDNREMQREGRSFMVDTLKSLNKDFPGQNLFLFIGCDAFNTITSWSRWQQLFLFAHLVVMTRPGFIRQELDYFLQSRYVDSLEEIAETKAGKLYFQPVTQLDISATAIRSLLAMNKSPEFLIPDPVIDYIKQNHIYKTIK